MIVQTQFRVLVVGLAIGGASAGFAVAQSSDGEAPPDPPPPALDDLVVDPVQCDDVLTEKAAASDAAADIEGCYQLKGEKSDTIEEAFADGIPAQAADAACAAVPPAVAEEHSSCAALDQAEGR